MISRGVEISIARCGGEMVRESSKDFCLSIITLVSFMQG